MSELLCDASFVPHHTLGFYAKTSGRGVVVHLLRVLRNPTGTDFGSMRVPSQTPKQENPTCQPDAWLTWPLLLQLEASLLLLLESIVGR